MAIVTVDPLVRSERAIVADLRVNCDAHGIFKSQKFGADQLSVSESYSPCFVLRRGAATTQNRRQNARPRVPFRRVNSSATVKFHFRPDWIGAGRSAMLASQETTQESRLGTSRRLLRWNCGRVAEWFKAAVLKTAAGQSPPWVRIPPLPPLQNRTANAGRSRFYARGGSERSEQIALRADDADLAVCHFDALAGAGRWSWRWPPPSILYPATLLSGAATLTSSQIAWQALAGPATGGQGRSRAAVARNAPALTGWRQSGLLAPKRSWFSLPCATA